MRYRTLNPATGELVREYETTSDAEIDRALAAAVHAAGGWAARPVEERAVALIALAEVLEQRSEELAALMTGEMGKPISEARAEIAKCALGCRTFAERGPGWLAPQEIESDARRSGVRYEPLGPLLAIMPWNYPYWQFFRFAAPALLAGNVVLLKHAPCTPGCALAIVEACREAGLSAGEVQNLFLTNAQAAAVIGDPRIHGVTLTGSTAAGRQVAEVAGRHLKPIVLELGGSDPFVVFADADLDTSIDTAVVARCQNSGQSCIAAKRFLVERSVYGSFVQRLTDRMAGLTVRDPRDDATQVGPLARRDLRDRLAEQVDASIAAGARVCCGGEVPDGPGFFYPPTVLADVPAGCPAADEELFGPVAAVFPFDGEDQVIRLANRTAYGLGASVWTSNAERAERLLSRIEAGAVFVNGMVRSDPRLPFGGVKASGHGRELGRDGLLAFTNPKTIWLR